MGVKYQDYYKLLGLERSASEKEIRNAYRKLARESHPDLKPKDKKKEAEEKFKLINEAYEVLKDPEKRKLYDRFGANWKHGEDFSAQQQQWNTGQRSSTGGNYRTQSFDFGSESGGSGFSDFFEAMFGQAFRDKGAGDFQRAGGYQRSRRPRKGMDVTAEMEVTLEEIYNAEEKQFQISMQDLCRACGGTGVQDNSFCSGCGGTGHMDNIKTLKIKIPKDARDGKKIRLKGQGGEAEPGAQRGDLYLKLKIKPHSVFKLKENDLEADLLVQPWQAVLGDRISAPTLEGSVRVKIPPRTHSGHKMRLRGKGMPKKDGSRGDYYLRVMVDIPQEVTSQEEELYRKLSEINH
ncbi:MAG: J domain-containing protein [Candidatus Contubernalis sp.]|nr:J domain-containing protein [Candidatus Contubernalis sp.]